MKNLRYRIIIPLLIIILFIIAASVASFATGYTYDGIDLAHRLESPSMLHLFGTDELGRDVLTRILYGARISLAVGIIPTAISALLGMFLGILAGFSDNFISTVIMRTADVLLSFPTLLLSMSLMYLLGGGLSGIIIVLTLVNWAGIARILRAETLKIKNSTYVEAAKCLGAGRFSIIFRHIIPNCLPTVLVLFTLDIPDSILAESSLGFLGLGIDNPTASWGMMVNTGRQFLYTHPSLCIIPGVIIMLLALSFYFLGLGMRTYFDPKQQLLIGRGKVWKK